MDDPSLLEKIVHPEDRERTLQHLRESLVQEGIRHIDFRVISRNGDPMSFIEPDLTITFWVKTWFVTA